MNQSLLRRTLETWQAEGPRGVAVKGRDRIRHEIVQAARRFRYFVLRTLGRGQKEDELIRDSVEYWNRGERFGVDVKDYSHWRGAGPWKDDERWMALGRPHRRLYDQLRNITGTSPARRIVEWGCGGGANAVHFISEAREFCGIEISQASLDECQRVLQEAGFDGFKGVLIEAEHPEGAVQSAGEGFDFLLSTYVFELIPSRKYGERILRVAHQMLRPGGLALVQIRYDDGSERSSQKNLDYFRDCTRFTSYRIEEFWAITEAIGFIPEFVWLAPRQTEEFSGDLYAYFGMRKPVTARNEVPVTGTSPISRNS
jgi:SAM-dependent methyltransferase